ncbi:MAG: phosphotransferase [bacterium]|nr:phosphotransferase [bacterium]
MENDKRTPVDRLNYTGSLEPVIKRLCGAYQIGEPTDFSVFELGYEDCNVLVVTGDKKYVAKIFSKGRSDDDIKGYVGRIEKVLEAGVNHPPLLTTTSGKTVYVDQEANRISMVLMQFVEGSSFYQPGRAPNSEELQRITEQAAKINSIDYHPELVYDSWAIPNIHDMFDRVKQFIEPDDLELVKEAISQYDQIPVSTLPYCFVHGDFTKLNVIKGDGGKMYILDFSVSNWYPRIQELAVIAANLLHDEKDDLSLAERCNRVADAYSKAGQLTEDERRYLLPYALAGIAMEFMGAIQEKYINGNDTEETKHWHNLGRNGLIQALRKTNP